MVTTHCFARASLIVAVLSCASVATAASPAPATPPIPTFELGLLGGVTSLTCRDCNGTVDGVAAAGAFALWHPVQVWGFGLSLDVTRAKWTSDPITGETPTPGGRVSETLTSGVVGPAVRFAPWAPRAVNPFVGVVIGTAFQSQSGSNFSCNDGLQPAAQLLLGAEGPITAWMRWDATLVATSGVLSSMCGVSDGPPATPLVTPGVGVRAGVAFGK